MCGEPQCHSKYVVASTGIYTAPLYCCMACTRALITNSRKAEGFGQIKGGSITPENAGIYLVRYTLGGLPAIEAAAYTQPSSKCEAKYASHLYRVRAGASTSHAPIKARGLSKIMVGGYLDLEEQNYVEHQEGYGGTDICKHYCGPLFSGEPSIQSKAVYNG